SAGSTVALSCAVNSAAPDNRNPCWLMASTCSFHTSYAQTSHSPALARCAANRLPTAPQPTTQILMNVPVSCVLTRHHAARLLSTEELPWYIGEALALSLTDAICVLRVKANFPVLIDHLWMQRENHVLPQLHIAVCADRWMLNHRRPDGVTGKMSQFESMLRERVC